MRSLRFVELLKRDGYHTSSNDKFLKLYKRDVLVFEFENDYFGKCLMFALCYNHFINNYPIQLHTPYRDKRKYYEGINFEGVVYYIDDNCLEYLLCHVV
jgi:hypothetical protein